MNTPETEQKPKLIIKTPNDGTVQGPVELVRDINEVFSSNELNEISFVRGALRCLGHSAIGDTEAVEKKLAADPTAQIPKVNPWKLMATVAKVTISKNHRKEAIARIKEDMAIGDGMGLLALVSIYGFGKKAGLTKEEAKNQALNWYSGSPINTTRQHP